MHRILLIATFLVFVQCLSAQDSRKELDLTTAVMEQYRSLAPTDIKGFHWLSDSRFLHYGDNKDLLIRNLDGDTLSRFTREELNGELERTGRDTLFGLSVRDVEGDRIYLNGANRVYAIKTNGEALRQVLVYPENSNNHDFHAGTETVAYTVGANVFCKSADAPEKKVTDHSPGSEVSAGIAIHRSEFGIRGGLFWSEKGEKLGFYEMDESDVTDYPLADYGEVPGRAKPLKYPMAGQASHYARVGIYDLDRDTTYYLKTEGPKDQYLTNFTFSPDGKKAYLAVVNRGQNEMHLNEYNAITGEFVKTLFTESDEAYVEPEHPPIFLKDGSFLWYSERDGFNHLYHYSSNGKLRNQVSSGDFDVLDFHGIFDQKALLEVSSNLMDESLILVDLNSGKRRKLTDESGTYSVDANPDEGMILVKERSMTVSNAVYILNAKGKKMMTLVDSDDPLADYALGDIELPVIEGEGGVKLQGRLIKPYDFDPERKYPVLVYVYGGPHVQLIRNNRTAGAPLWMFHAANRGYVVFTIDGRGSAHRGLAFEQETFRNLGTLEMEDQLKGVEYLKTLPYVDSERMAVHGWSFGGFMTTSLMLRHPEVFDVGIAGGPVTDWRLYEVMYTERYMDTPEENPKGYETADIKNYVDNLEGDLLLIHGLDDDVVVPQHSYTLLEAFVDAGVQVDFFVYPGHPHNVRGKDRVHLMTKVLKYIDDHLN